MTALRKQVLAPSHALRWLAITCVAIVLTVGAVARKAMRSFGESKVEVTKRHIDNLAYNAVHAYRATHDGHCPSADDPMFLQFADWSDDKDAWGTPIAIRCGTTWNFVATAGEDTKFGTADDYYVLASD
jgi:hypothetical protein